MRPFSCLLGPCGRRGFRRLTKRLQQILYHRRPRLRIHVTQRVIQLPLAGVCCTATRGRCIHIIASSNRYQTATGFTRIRRRLRARPRFLIYGHNIVVGVSGILQFRNSYVRVLSKARLPIQRGSGGDLLTRFARCRFHNVRQRF